MRRSCPRRSSLTKRRRGTAHGVAGCQRMEGASAAQVCPFAAGTLAGVRASAAPAAFVLGTCTDFRNHEFPP